MFWSRYEILPREAPSKLALLAVPVGTILLAIISSVFLFTLLGKPPGLVLYSFFVEPFTSTYNISELIIKASPLILIAQGLAIGFRTRVWNIGAEGQLVIGAIFASLIPITWNNADGIWVLPMMILAGALGGMFWAAIAAFFRVVFNASEIIVTLMLNQIALQILLYLITGPLLDPRGFNFPQSVSFQDAALYPNILAEAGVRANLSIVITLFVSIAAWIFVTRSFSGFKMLVGGLSPNAALYAGFSAKGAIWLSLIIGGAAAGLAGVGEVAGPIGRLQPILSPGYGFAAIIVAFLGALNPIGIFFAGIFMAVVYVGADGAILNAGVPASAPIVFQGFILIFYLACFAASNYRLRRKPVMIEAS